MEFFVYVLLIITSVVGLTFIIERGLALRWRRVVPPEVEAAVESCHSPEDVPMLRRVCQQHDAPISRLLLLAADHLHW
ncbi:MAG TPA: MotA/TolQ/ExbB proton channel family protein, partial [Bacillota bacterium]|nr:MotA/TolQ/ExbB proton channel family protein [Bacillota bacterium]